MIVLKGNTVNTQGLSECALGQKKKKRENKCFQNSETIENNVFEYLYSLSILNS